MLIFQSSRFLAYPARSSASIKGRRGVAAAGAACMSWPLACASRGVACVVACPSAGSAVVKEIAHIPTAANTTFAADFIAILPFPQPSSDQTRLLSLHGFFSAHGRCFVDQAL